MHGNSLPQLNAFFVSSEWAFKLNHVSYLEKRYVGVEDVVKVDGGIEPVDTLVERLLVVADRPVGDDFVRKFLPGRRVDALVVLAHERVHADDGKDEPEDEAHELELVRYSFFRECTTPVHSVLKIQQCQWIFYDHT